MVELVIPTASISVVDYTYEEGAGAASVVITGFSLQSFVQTLWKPYSNDSSRLILAPTILASSKIRNHGLDF